MKALVTGCAGFIGSNLMDRLLKNGHEVVGVDNLSTGYEEFLEKANKKKKFKFYNLDILNKRHILNSLMEDIDTVFHLAANADVRDGWKHPHKDLLYNTIGTGIVLASARQSKTVKRFMFSSTGSVYGDADTIPTPESYASIQTSLYGASKLSAESFIQAYCEESGMKGYIFRFVSILGQRYSHGHVIDFYRKLLKDPTRLVVQGDGTQRKSYLHVNDCITGILLTLKKGNGKEKVNIYNLGTNETCTVNDSIGWITKNLDISPEVVYTGGKRGWIGDSPHIHLDCTRMNGIGWKPKYTIEEGILSTLKYLQENEWILKE